MKKERTEVYKNAIHILKVARRYGRPKQMWEEQEETKYAIMTKDWEEDAGKKFPAHKELLEKSGVLPILESVLTESSDIESPVVTLSTDVDSPDYPLCYVRVRWDYKDDDPRVRKIIPNLAVPIETWKEVKIVPSIFG